MCNDIHRIKLIAQSRSKYNNPYKQGKENIMLNLEYEKKFWMMATLKYLIFGGSLTLDI